jgi:hypothetical protein
MLRPAALLPKSLHPLGTLWLLLNISMAQPSTTATTVAVPVAETAVAARDLRGFLGNPEMIQAAIHIAVTVGQPLLLEPTASTIITTAQSAAAVAGLAAAPVEGEAPARAVTGTVTQVG